MARFPYYNRNVKALGELLAKAATDPALSEALKADPKKLLSDIGLPGQTTELLRFSVVEQTPGEKVVSLPYRLNKEKLNQEDADYLTGIASLVQ